MYVGLMMSLWTDQAINIAIKVLLLVLKMIARISIRLLGMTVSLMKRQNQSQVKVNLMHLQVTARTSKTKFSQTRKLQKLSPVSLIQVNLKVKKMHRKLLCQKVKVKLI